MEFARAPASITRGSRPRRWAEIAHARPTGPAPAITARSCGTGDIRLTIYTWTCRPGGGVLVFSSTFTPPQERPDASSSSSGGRQRSHRRPPLGPAAPGRDRPTAPHFRLTRFRAATLRPRPVDRGWRRLHDGPTVGGGPGWLGHRPLRHRQRRAQRLRLG